MALTPAACVRTDRPDAPPPAPLVFPPPPLEARVQYLGAISSARDLPHKRNSFAEFVLGRAPDPFPLIKPISALISRDKLYVCDTVLNTVIVYDLETGATGRLSGDRANGKIQQPNNIAADAQGRLYVADKLRQAVLVYGPDGEFLRALGRPGEASPVAVAVGEGRLYICDIRDHQIEVWDSDSGDLIEVIGEKGTAPNQFYLPTQIALDAEGNIYVTDTGNFRVRKLSPSGEPLMQFGGFGDGLGQFAWPKGMDVDDRGRVYVADSRFANIQIFDAHGRLLLFFGGPGPDRGNLDLPAGLSVLRWPSNRWLEARLSDGFDPEFLVIAVSQKGAGFINFFAVARETDTEGSL